LAIALNSPAFLNFKYFLPIRSVFNNNFSDFILIIDETRLKSDYFHITHENQDHL